MKAEEVTDTLELANCSRGWHGVKLRQSFLRVGKHAHREVARLIHGRGHKQAMRWVRKLRTWLGRLDRDIGRKIAGNDVMETVFAVARERTGRILVQRAGDTDKLYAFHAPEVECIATGDAINALLVAAGHNLRLLIAWLATLLRAWITAWLLALQPAAIAA